MRKLTQLAQVCALAVALGALEMSILGYDVLKLFTLIIDRPGNTVCLLVPPQSYIIPG